LRSCGFSLVRSTAPSEADCGRIGAGFGAAGADRSRSARIRSARSRSRP
jgi:hypothetical protein